MIKEFTSIDDQTGKKFKIAIDLSLNPIKGIQQVDKKWSVIMLDTNHCYKVQASFDSLVSLIRFPELFITQAN